MLFGLAVVSTAEPVKATFSSIFIRGNSAVTPLRDLVLTANLSLAWDETNKTASVSGKSLSVSITVGKKSLMVNGVEKILPIAAFRHRDMLYVPLNPVALLLGGSIYFAPPKVTVSFGDRIISGTLTAPPVQAKIVLTKIPPSGEGENSWGTIAGYVTGINNYSDYRVVIYSVTDYAYVQPWANNPFTSINKRGKFSSGIHLGWHYTILLVKRSYKPEAVTTDEFAVGGDILAITRVTPR